MDSLHAGSPIPLFLHIPKTAGSTLASLVYKNYPYALGVYPGESEGWAIEDALAPPAPDTLAALADPELGAAVGHFAFGLHRFVPRPSPYVTVLRDPVERVGSIYDHEVVWLQDTHGVVSEGLSLSEYVTSGVSRDVDNGQVRRLCDTDFAFGACSPRILARAKDNLSRFSVVGLTERFDETLLVIARKLGWERLLYVPRLVNRHRKDLDAPSANVLAEIAELNRFDAELYRFAGELLDSAIESMGAGFDSELREARATQAEFARRSAEAPVDLSVGTVDELAALPGIGEVLARRIVERREQTGGFRQVRQLLEIPGIGRARYRTLIELVATSTDERP